MGGRSSLGARVCSGAWLLFCVNVWFKLFGPFELAFKDPGEIQLNLGAVFCLERILLLFLRYSHFCLLCPR